MGDTDMDSPQVDHHGETSKEGLRRMQRLASHAHTVGYMSKSLTHPTSEVLVYPAPAGYSEHVMASLYAATPPRPLPTPPVLGPSREICSSPDGRWIVLFHPSLIQNGANGGTLAIYPSEILLPFTTSSTIIPHSTLPLPRCPLAISPLYPDRAHTVSGVLPVSGPHPPPSHDPAKGPVLVVLMPDGVLLIHPHRLPTGDWGMNVLKTTLETRSYVRTGDPSPLSGKEAGRGWMGIVPGNKGVWAGVEIRGEIKVVKVDVGTDENARWFLMTSPMPTLPEFGLDEENRELQGLVFTTISAGQRAKVHPEGGEATANESVGMIVISQESSEGTARAQLDLVGFERREVALVDSFNEMTGQNDSPMSWDWFSLPNVINTTSSPWGTTVLEVAPLLSTLPDSLALALLSTPKGIVLTRLGLAKEHVESEGHWSAIRGDEVVLGDVEVSGMVLSQSAARGGLGLVGVMNEQGIVLVLSPSAEGLSGKSDSPEEPGRASKSLIQAIKEGVDWSDIVRAVQGSIEASEQDSIVHSILQEVYQAVNGMKGRDEIQQMTPLQVAFYGLYDKGRQNLASEMGKLAEASRLFTAVASHKDGTVSFDLDHVWELIFVSEWVYATMAKIFREVVSEKGRLEWGLEQPAALDLIYVLSPFPRTLVCRLLAQLKAFGSFVQTLNRPILPPESHFSSNTSLTARNVQAALMAKDRVKGMSGRYGVSVLKWGKALVSLHKAKPKVTDQDISAFLRLQIDFTPEELKTILQSFPSPSSLFEIEPSAEMYDAVTYMPLPKAVGAKCNRCGWYTLTVVKRPVGAGREDGIGGWREARRGGCGCGGSWIRG